MDGGSCGVHRSLWNTALQLYRETVRRDALINFNSRTKLNLCPFADSANLIILFSVVY